MDYLEQRVILLRAWRDVDGVRIRVLTFDEARRQWVMGGVDEVCALIATLLADLSPPEELQTGD